MAAILPAEAHAQTVEGCDSTWPVETIIDYTWPDYAQDYAKTIAWRESGYDPYAYNPSGATGLFQIIDFYGYGTALYDPCFNSAVAADLYMQLGWSPWVTAY